MIVVTGNVIAKPECFDEALKLSTEHVARSREEPGCISHGVTIDSENSMNLVFFEEWEDMSRLEQHFRVPESGEFVKALANLAVSPPKMRVFEAKELER
jgi:quinol monooxygenase YgiN